MTKPAGPPRPTLKVLSLQRTDADAIALGATVPSSRDESVVYSVAGQLDTRGGWFAQCTCPARHGCWHRKELEAIARAANAALEAWGIERERPYEGDPFDGLPSGVSIQGPGINPHEDELARLRANRRRSDA